MIKECLAIAITSVLGVSIMGLAGGRSPWLLGVLALPTGIAGASLISLLIVTIGFRPDVVIVLSVSLVVAILIPLLSRSHRPPATATAVVVGVLAVLAGVLYRLGLVTVTVDSFLYMSVGSMLETAGLITVPPHHVQRGLILPIIHSTGEAFYLRSLTPLIAASTIGTVVWAGSAALGIRARDTVGRLLVVGIAALLLTNNRFIFNSFYVNTHMLFAVWLLVVVAVPWLIAVKRVDERMLFIVAIVLPALSILRPEAALYAPIILVGVLSSQAIGVRWKSVLLIVVGLTAAIWQSTLIRSFASRGDVPMEVIMLTAMGGFLAITGVVWKWLEPWVAKLLAPIALGLVLLSLALLAFQQPQIFQDSLAATVENVVLGEGLYGISILVLVGLLLVGTWRRVPSMRILTFPLLTAPPFLFLMAHLRSDAYRVGPGDSFNRMLLHWLPLAAFLLLALTVDGRANGNPVRVSSDDRVDFACGEADPL